MSQHRTADTSSAASWGIVGVMFLVCLVVGQGLGFRISPAGAVLPFIVILLLVAGMIVGRAGGRPRLYEGATAFLQMTLFTIIGVVLAYVIAAGAGPLWDNRFAAADARLGFDWPALFAAADRVPFALWIGGLAYHSLTLQMVVCIVVLSATRQEKRLRVAVVAAVTSGFVTIAISGLMPAMGNVFDPRHYHNLWPSIAWLERDMIAGLRDGSWRTLNLTQLMGIVSFPSYHATLPIILAWAQRGIRRWRVLAWAWAGLTILATPVFGGHYAVDVLGGMALAWPAIALAPWLTTWRAGGVRICRKRSVRPVSVEHAGASPAFGGGLADEKPVVLRRIVTTVPMFQRSLDRLPSLNWKL